VQGSTPTPNLILVYPYPAKHNEAQSMSRPYIASSLIFICVEKAEMSIAILWEIILRSCNNLISFTKVKDSYIILSPTAWSPYGPSSTRSNEQGWDTAVKQSGTLSHSCVPYEGVRLKEQL
jgi:hypothetical protein